MALLYRDELRLTAQNGGVWSGQATRDTRKMGDGAARIARQDSTGRADNTAAGASSTAQGDTRKAAAHPARDPDDIVDAELWTLWTAAMTPPPSPAAKPTAKTKGSARSTADSADSASGLIRSAAEASTASPSPHWASALGPEPTSVAEPGQRAEALAAEVERRGLVRRENSFSSRYKGVCLDKNKKKWQAQVTHGGKRDHLGDFATEEEAKAAYDARCLKLGRDPDAGTSSGFRGVSWFKQTGKWRAQIKFDGKHKRLGFFEGTARGEVDAALAFDVAVRSSGRPEKANFQLPVGDTVSVVGGAAMAPPAADPEQAAALAAEIQRRGLVQRDKFFSSGHKGVCWHKPDQKWDAQVTHGGKQEPLGYSATEDEAKARYDDHCVELEIDPGPSSGFRGVCWFKRDHKWTALISIDGKQKHLGYFEGTARGEVDAALAHDAAARAVGRAEKVNFVLAVGDDVSAAGEAASTASVAQSEQRDAAAAAEVQRRGLVRRDNSFSSRYKGVSWHKMRKNWQAKVAHGGKREHLGCFTTEEEAKAAYDTRCRELGVDPDASALSDFLGVTWNKRKRKWETKITVDGKQKRFGYFEGTARGEVDAALAYDVAARAVGQAEKANFQLPVCDTTSVADSEQRDAALTEVQRRGLVLRDNSFSSRYKGVSWHKPTKKWQTEVTHGGKNEYLGYFATEQEAKARCDARCQELGISADAGKSSYFHGVTWYKRDRKWTAQITVDGKNQALGHFEATARGEVDAALAYDVAARAAGRPKKANFGAANSEVPAAGAQCLRTEHCTLPHWHTVHCRVATRATEAQPNAHARWVKPGWVNRPPAACGGSEPASSDSDEEEWTEEGQGRRPRKAARGNAAAPSGIQVSNAPGGRNEAAASSGGAPCRQVSWAMCQNTQGSARMRVVWSTLCHLTDGSSWQGSTDRGRRGVAGPSPSLGIAPPFK
jgi:hypothetical protein